MLKKLKSILLIAIFSCNSLSIALMSVWYMQDQQYFTDNFCINKEKVEMKCQGRCHLKKQFKQGDSSSSKKVISVPLLELEFTYQTSALIIARDEVSSLTHRSEVTRRRFETPILKTIIPPPNLT